MMPDEVGRGDDYNRVHIRLEFSFACDLVGYGGSTLKNVMESVGAAGDRFALAGMLEELGDNNKIKVFARHRGELESWEIDG